MTTATLTSREALIRRVMKHFGISEEEARCRLARLDAREAASLAEPGYAAVDIVVETR